MRTVHGTGQHSPRTAHPSATTRRAAGIVAALAAAALLGSAALPAAYAQGPGHGRHHPRPHPQVSTATYTPSDENIANPQRGFYHHTETHYRADGSGYTPLDQATLAGYRAEGITQILRVFYLEKFAGTPQLDQAFLDLVQADYDTARAAGVSVITRFAYAQGGEWPYSPPYGDAPLSTVLAHIDQLGPLLRANADVVPVVQNGFVGLWGEGYYTDHFVADPADPGVVTDADWANRSAVTQALLDELPESRAVQVRTMLSKQRLLGVPSGAGSAVGPGEAWTGETIARVGHHNDCLLASPDDFGTFLSDPITLDQEYLEAESRYVPVGGETCAVNAPRSEWASASAELARYHYSYLNRDYNQDVLNSWGQEGIAETARRLGYRFVLESSSVSARGSAPTVSVTVRNDGWAAPYTPRPATLVLTRADGTEVTVPFGSDARSWLPGTTTTLTAALADVPAGTYTLALGLPSADAGTSGDPRFAIRTANVGTWDTTRGVNVLEGTVTVG
ncbi:DUF4832 domain-containing protein [Promicromonospora sp. NPDC050880]|uniref:DUF4832 domain-containing protein n=1 Tax=Promicromonospora sp. NPDC050880 TaxID=3364406 RepID=UPI0037A8ED32